MMKVFLERTKGFLADYIPAVKRGRQVEKLKKQIDMIKISDKFTPEEYRRLFLDENGIFLTNITDAIKNYNSPFRAELYTNPLKPEIRGAIMNLGARSVYVNTAAPQQEIREALIKVTSKPFHI